MRVYKATTKQNSKVLCHLPHSSIYLPAKDRGSFLLAKKELTNEARKMADLHTAELFSPLSKKTSSFTASLSRLVVDVERFPDDQRESMSKAGMGFAYSKTSDGKALRLLTLKQKENLLKQYFYPYHLAMEKMVQQILNKRQSCLIIDCHSFPDKPRRYEPSQRRPRPDICLGIDSFHTPKQLWRPLVRAFQKAGLSVKINDPFAGTLVPLKFYKKNKKVQSIMIEVNRKLYMDENTFKKKKNFLKVSRLICSIINNGISN